MIVAAPKDEEELQNLLYTAVMSGQTMSIRYPRGNGQGINLSGWRQLSVGKGEIIKNGKDLAILAAGSMVYPAVEAAKFLSEEGINAAVFNARFVKPLDSGAVLELALNTHRLMTVEENVLTGGFGSSVLDLLSQAGLTQIKVERLGLPDRFIEHGNMGLFRAQFDLDAPGIVRRVKSAFPELLLKK